MGGVNWLDWPEDHDYDAAVDYLSLLTSRVDAERIADSLHGRYIRTGKAKDLLRASQLPLLSADNVHVAKDLRKIHKGEPLSPILLVQGVGNKAVPLIVADGYHRIVASYLHDENTDIPYQITTWDC